ncbi:hypothetical protein M9H77_22181 [Catharanthus roseus]|uniref:Uncharacterized protein n=1 Tax=Catharanthus roseus TaxID=4058 RepID=A0ACC0ATS8_CATRO|nr:hypothetical protein M9H77_22181 [Catharanthus roseus]
MPDGQGSQQPNLFLCLPQLSYVLFSLLLLLCSFLFFYYCLFSVNSSVAIAFFLIRFWHLNISVPLFYTETGRLIFCVLWIEEKLVVCFSDTSSDFGEPFLRVVIRFHHPVILVSEPEGDLIFLVSGVGYIPLVTQTSSETSQNLLVTPLKVKGILNLEIRIE